MRKVAIPKILFVLGVSILFSNWARAQSYLNCPNIVRVKQRGTVGPEMRCSRCFFGAEQNYTRDPAEPDVPFHRELEPGGVVGNGMFRAGNASQDWNTEAGELEEAITITDVTRLLEFIFQGREIVTQSEMTSNFQLFHSQMAKLTRAIDLWTAGNLRDADIPDVQLPIPLEVQTCASDITERFEDPWGFERTYKQYVYAMMDVNGDQSVDISDAMALLHYLFIDGARSPLSTGDYFEFDNPLSCSIQAPDALWCYYRRDMRQAAADQQTGLLITETVLCRRREADPCPADPVYSDQKGY